MLSTDPTKNLVRYVAWVKETALPVWAEHGFDLRRGRFHERLNGSGAPVDVPHRAMVQARQIYVFAHAAKLGWFPDGARLAATAMAGLLRHYCDERATSASFHFSADGAGNPISAVRDSYTHAFLLFALAWLHALDDDPAHLRLADKIIEFIDSELVDTIHDGVFDALPVSDRSKRQNPLMHLLEAYLFLDEAAPGRGYLERASALVALFKLRLLRPEPGIVIEHFSEDWSAHADAGKASVFEPGHHFEWAWLLDRYGRRFGIDETSTIECLHRTALAHGVAANGLIYDEVGSDMRPVKKSHRVWPHTEAIKAGIVRHEAGDASGLAMAAGMAEQLLTTFLDRPFTGGWIDHTDEAGSPLWDYVPASSLYHLFLAATEAARGTAAIREIQRAIS